MTWPGADLAWFLAAVALLGAGTAGLARWAGAGLGWQPLIVLGRAAVQLAVIALVLTGVLSAPWMLVAFVALMLTTASWTAGGRIARIPHGRRFAVIGVLGGAAVAVPAVFTLRLVEFEPRTIVAISGIVIGNAMSAATLSGRNFANNAVLRRDELEGWFALGASPSQATMDVGRSAIRETLIPTLDQTRNTGLVTLPGAFVGALFGGANPAQAAQFQVVVLASVALAMVITAIVITRLAGRAPTLLIPEAT